MKLAELLEILKERGCEIVVGQDGQPRIKGPKGQITPAILKVLTLRREEIVQRYRPREYLNVFGGRFVSYDPDYDASECAFWWRYRGEGDKAWRGIKGTPGEWESPEWSMNWERDYGNRKGLLPEPKRQQ